MRQRGGGIVVAGHNFGQGSSGEDEHLIESTAELLAQMWALLDRGGVTRQEARVLCDAQLRLGLTMAETLEVPQLRDYWKERLTDRLRDLG